MDNTNPSGQPLQIDLHTILRNRISGWKRFLIPGFIISRIEKIIHQDDLNNLLRVCYPDRGSSFASKLLNTLDIKVNVSGLDNIPKDRPFIFVSNHPLGGLDGIALVAVLGKYFGDENLRVQVNDLLMNVDPLKEVFLPINKYGSQGRKSAKLINQAFESGKQIVIFPAGLVSRLGDDGSIADLKWHKAFISKAIAYNRDIVPIKFDALNSIKFYRAARRRKKLGIKINLEQVLLPSELVKAKRKTFNIIFKQPISPSEVQEMASSPSAGAEKIKQIVYNG